MQVIQRFLRLSYTCSCSDSVDHLLIPTKTTARSHTCMQGSKAHRLGKKWDAKGSGWRECQLYLSQTTDRRIRKSLLLSHLWDICFTSHLSDPRPELIIKTASRRINSTLQWLAYRVHLYTASSAMCSNWKRSCRKLNKLCICLLPANIAHEVPFA